MNEPKDKVKECTSKNMKTKTTRACRKQEPIVRLGPADYKCNVCGGVYQRDLGWKTWTPSFCEKTGRNARLYRVSAPSKPNAGGQTPAAHKETV